MNVSSTFLSYRSFLNWVRDMTLTWSLCYFYDVRSHLTCAIGRTWIYYVAILWVSPFAVLWLKGFVSGLPFSPTYSLTSLCRPTNQSEQTGLWFQTEGEKRWCSTGSMRKIKSFLNIKAWRHVPGETLHTHMNLKIGIKGPLQVDILILNLNKRLTLRATSTTIFQSGTLKSVYN